MLRSLRASALGLIALSIPAYAGIVSTIEFDDGFGNTGGEFVAYPTDFDFVPVSLSGGQPFETFCIEKNESLAFDAVYYAVANSAAIHGGAGGGDPDPLDPLSAYLYQRFVTGVLANYVYDISDGGDDRAESADDLQAVIWFIEQEEALSWTPGDGSRRDLFYADALANAGATIGDVRVLNIYGDAAATIPHQDVLVLTPEPASLALLLLGTALLRRRR